MLAIVAVGVVRESRQMYRAHCAVIFAIAQLSCIVIVLPVYGESETRISISR